MIPCRPWIRHGAWRNVPHTLVIIFRLQCEEFWTESRKRDIFELKCMIHFVTTMRSDRRIVASIHIWTFSVAGIFCEIFYMILPRCIGVLTWKVYLRYLTVKKDMLDGEVVRRPLVSVWSLVGGFQKWLLLRWFGQTSFPIAIGGNEDCQEWWRKHFDLCWC